jgi:hypothetical protein
MDINLNWVRNGVAGQRPFRAHLLNGQLKVSTCLTRDFFSDSFV